MNVIFCKPELTMTELKVATVFLQECSELLSSYVPNVHTVYFDGVSNESITCTRSK